MPRSTGVVAPPNYRATKLRAKLSNLVSGSSVPGKKRFSDQGAFNAEKKFTAQDESFKNILAALQTQSGDQAKKATPSLMTRSESMLADLAKVKAKR